MEPTVAYAHTTDGVRIGWTSLGSGPPLVVMPSVPFGNFAGDWRIPVVRESFARLGAALRVIQYDARGGGHSQRVVTDLSMEAFLRDLDAVLDATGAGQAALLGRYHAATQALAYAARRPERVSHVIVFCGTARGFSAMSARQTQALLSLIDQDWDVFVESAAHQWLGWEAGESGRLEVDSLRTSTSPEVATAAIREAALTDVTSELPRVLAPVLVLHREHAPQVPLEESRELAAALPNGRLQIIPGESPALFFHGDDDVLDLIVDFVSGRPGSVPTTGGATSVGRPEPPPPHEPLTPRELEVLRLVAQGEANGEIAAQLGLSIHTVERHVTNVYRKIDARGRADATAFAVRRGLA